MAGHIAVRTLAPRPIRLTSVLPTSVIRCSFFYDPGWSPQDGRPGDGSVFEVRVRQGRPHTVARRATTGLPSPACARLTPSRAG